MTVDFIHKNSKQLLLHAFLVKKKEHALESISNSTVYFLSYSNNDNVASHEAT